jgi:hypothetical protein
MTLGELESIREVLGKVRELLKGVGMAPTIAASPNARASLGRVFEEIAGFERDHVRTEASHS